MERSDRSSSTGGTHGRVTKRGSNPSCLRTGSFPIGSHHCTSLRRALKCPRPKVALELEVMPLFLVCSLLLISCCFSAGASPSITHTSRTPSCSNADSRKNRFLQQSTSHSLDLFNAKLSAEKYWQGLRLGGGGGGTIPNATLSLPE